MHQSVPAPHPCMPVPHERMRAQQTAPPCMPAGAGAKGSMRGGGGGGACVHAPHLGVALQARCHRGADACMGGTKGECSTVIGGRELSHMPSLPP